jgi:hypothetical protein
MHFRFTAGILKKSFFFPSLCCLGFVFDDGKNLRINTSNTSVYYYNEYFFNIQNDDKENENLDKKEEEENDTNKETYEESDSEDFSDEEDDGKGGILIPILKMFG